MANIVLFHSVLGLRNAVKAAAEKLREAGHTVFTPDLYSGEVFDDMETADIRFQEIGISASNWGTIGCGRDTVLSHIHFGVTHSDVCEQ